MTKVKCNSYMVISALLPRYQKKKLLDQAPVCKTTRCNWTVVECEYTVSISKTGIF